MNPTISELIEALDRWADRLWDAFDAQLSNQFGDEEFPTGMVTVEIDFTVLDSAHHCMVKAGTALEKLQQENNELRDEVRTLLSVLQARGVFS